MDSHHSIKIGGFSGSNLRDSMSKKQKNRVEEETLDDRLSQLPDALLIQILSLLPTYEAVRSCVLSKRWRYLWTCVYNFLFNIPKRNFISFVDHVLTHSTCSKIKKFHLILWDSKINQWLNFAVENKVEDVKLYSYFDDGDFTYKLPLCMYTCSSLITLYLSHWVLEKEQVIAWNSLKRLKLHIIGLDDEDIVKLLSGCPALETLELSMFWGFRRLEINSSNLKRLNLHYHPGGKEPRDVLEIFAPYLQHLELTGDFGYLKCRLVNVSSLVSANFTFNIGCICCRTFHQVTRNLVLDYLQKLTYTTELVIGSWFAKVVFMLQLKKVPLPELRWKCLTLEMHTKYIPCGVASLLRILPFLETLNIEMGDWSGDINCTLEQSNLAEGDAINLQSWMSNIVFPNLKNVKILCFTTNCLKGPFEGGNVKLFELSEFLLKSAMALKKFVIISGTSSCEECSERCVSRYLSQLAKKLLESPRSSRNLMITYKEYFA